MPGELSLRTYRLLRFGPLLPDPDNAGEGRHIQTYLFYCLLKRKSGFGKTGNLNSAVAPPEQKEDFFMSKQNSQIRVLVEGAVMVALATALSFIRIIKMPWGGSVTLLSMLPIMIFAIRRGFAAGMACSFVYSLVQFGQGIMDGLFGWGLTPGMLVACIFLDYILAFTAIGLAGSFRSMDLKGWIAGVVLASVVRFFIHFLSGCLIWQSFGALWGDFFTENTFLYSFLYNGAYMLPETVFTLIGAVILLRAPQTRKFILNDVK